MPRRTALFTLALIAAIAVRRIIVPEGYGSPLLGLTPGLIVWWALAARTRAEFLRAVAIAGVVLVASWVLSGGSAREIVFFTVSRLTMMVVARLAARGFDRLVVVRRQDDLPSLSQMRVPADAYRLLAASTVGVLATLPLFFALTTGTQPTGQRLVTASLSALASIMLIAGLGLALTGGPRVEAPVRRREVVALFALAVVAFAIIYAFRLPLAIGFGMSLLTFWTAVRLPVRWAALHAATVPILGVIVLTLGADGFVLPEPRIVAAAVQFMAVFSMSVVLVVSTAMAEREQLISHLRAAERLARRQAEDLGLVTRTIPDALMTVDSSGVMTPLNDAAGSTIYGGGAGWRPDRVRRMDGTPFPDSDRPILRALQGQTVLNEPLRYADDGGDEHFYLVSAVPLSDSGGSAERIVVLARDVSDAYADAVAIREARAEAERLFADAPYGVALLTRDGDIVKANAALASMLGRSTVELEGRRLADLAPGQGSVVNAALDETLEGGGEAVAWDWEIAGTGDAHLRLAVTSRLLPAIEQDKEDRLLVNFADLSERHRYESRLAHVSSHDGLTGLRNRRWFEAELAEHVTRYRTGGGDAALILLDIDAFKETNDTRGHTIGDQLLITLGRLLTQVTGESGTVSRLGADEFAILRPHADQATAEAFVSDLLDRIRSTEFDGRRVTASAGLVLMESAVGHEAGPLALADMLIFDAKEAGGDRYETLAPGSSYQPRAGIRMTWKRRIEQALDNGDFRLHLQPIARATTGRIAGAEALIRLHDGDEIVMPGAFMHIAEQTGLSPRLDAWVVRERVRILAELQRISPHMRLSLNLAGPSMGHPLIEEALLKGLSEERVDPRRLVLEVTETAAVVDIVAARAFAERVSGIGAHLALDDFGTGFGSFYYLKHLLFDVVKINGEFIAQSATSSVDRSIVRSIVSVARDLGKQTVAEFVSSEGALEVVRAEGIDYAQGYLIGKPCPVDEFIRLYLTPTNALTGTENR